MAEVANCLTNLVSVHSHLLVSNMLMCLFVCACACACVSVCVCARVRACVCVCVCVCVSCITYICTYLKCQYDSACNVNICLVYVCMSVHTYISRQSRWSSLPPPPLTWHMLRHAEKNKVLFTYSVEWVKSDVAWASRWDTYLRMSDVQVSWNHCPLHPSVEDFHK